MLPEAKARHTGPSSAPTRVTLLPVLAACGGGPAAGNAAALLGNVSKDSKTAIVSND